jgi:hypothetical protein
LALVGLVGLWDGHQAAVQVLLFLMNTLFDVFDQADLDSCGDSPLL